MKRNQSIIIKSEAQTDESTQKLQSVQEAHVTPHQDCLVWVCMSILFILVSECDITSLCSDNEKEVVWECLINL